MLIVHLWTLVANVLNKQSQTTVLTVKYFYHVTNHSQMRRTWITGMIKSRRMRWVRRLSHMRV